jgi:DNA-binding NarL/FixJ family response regulator
MSRAAEFMTVTAAFCGRLRGVQRLRGARSPISNGVRQPQPGRAPVHASAPPRFVVLVVDDDAAVREALHLLLDEDFAVIEAAHGRAALDIVRAEHVDLVLLDILMPEVDGLEILQELRTLEPELPIIMITAVKTVRTSVAAMKLGAHDYVTKPFQEEELLATMRLALEPRTRRLSASGGRTHPESPRPLPRTQRILLVGGDHGWRAAVAVTLARVAAVETSETFSDGLNRLLRFRPTGVVLNVGRSAGEAGRFAGALAAQLPACPVLVLSDDAYLGDTPVWEALNVRGVLSPAVSAGDLVSRIGTLLPPGGSLNGSWPQLGDSVSRAVDYLSRHFDEDLTVEGIADIVDISSSHLAHLFRSEIGMSVRDYLTRVRVTIAQALLAHTDEKLESVAARLGFADPSHLAHVFQRITGRPPSAYRRSAS